MTWFLFLLVRSDLLAKVNPKVRCERLFSSFGMDPVMFSWKSITILNSMLKAIVT